MVVVVRMPGTADGVPKRKYICVERWVPLIEDIVQLPVLRL